MPDGGAILLFLFRPFASPWKTTVTVKNHCYHVDWYVTSTVHSDVNVRIEGERVTSIEPGRASDAIDLGPVALVSGLVNAHTHLEFSNLAQPFPPDDRFTNWIRAVISHRLSDLAGTGRAIEAGLRESLQSGTTLVGEIASQNWTERDYTTSKIDIVAFQEVLGLLPARVAQQKEILSTFADTNYAAFQNGLSPHAPYSTHLELVRHAVALAKQHAIPIAMHLAETKSELAFLGSQRGEFQEFLAGMGLWNDDPTRFGKTAREYLEILSQAPRALVIHGNYLSDDELAFLAKHPQMTLVYCPRTHSAFGHDAHPWLRARALGIRVAIGTDSRASNPNLSLFQELQFLARQFTNIPHLDLLRMGSTNGRNALLGDVPETACLTLIRPSEGQPFRDPQTDLFASANSVAGTMIRGEWAWTDEMLQKCLSS